MIFIIFVWYLFLLHLIMAFKPIFICFAYLFGIVIKIYLFLLDTMWAIGMPGVIMLPIEIESFTTYPLIGAKILISFI